MTKKQPLHFRKTFGRIAYVSFERIAYVTSCGDTILDNIEHSGLPIHMTGEGMCLTDYESLVSFLEDDKNKKAEAYKNKKVEAYMFLDQVRIFLDKNPEDIIGDVIFTS
jgi:hypothetical protein